LQRAGVAPGLIDAPAADAVQFDSEALWQRVSSQVQAGKAWQKVLIVRGTSGLDASAAKGVGRDWLAQQLDAVGVTVELLASYQRVVPVLDAAQMKLAHAAAADGSVWLFSSSEAIRNLRQALPAQDWLAARAVATHARIAAAARLAGFTQVLESRPSLGDILASIESLT
jgi:uroporphyrinogen-III synthase